MLSYWEASSWYEGNDFCIVGAGIVGLSTAIHLREKYPKARILVIDRGFLPTGASTKNAGFACFGSLGEILQDFKDLGTDRSLALIKKRWEGLHYLRNTFGEQSLDYKACSSYELFDEEDDSLFEECQTKISEVNNLLKQNLNVDECFRLMPNTFGFRTPFALLQNFYEGSLDTGKMMSTIIRKCYASEINILWSNPVNSFSRVGNKWELKVAHDQVVSSNNLIFCTNAFAKKLLPNLDVEPYRNQVFITDEIEDLKLNACFHAKRGYVYFRNVGKRLLVGGARHLFMDDESTDTLGYNDNNIQWLKNYTEKYITSKAIQIDRSWSGILSGGQNKEAIISRIEDRLYCGVRLGGMGVAIGYLLGKELAELVS